MERAVERDLLWRFRYRGRLFWEREGGWVEEAEEVISDDPITASSELHVPVRAAAK